MMGEYLTSSEAAEMLRIKAKTLNNMKARGLFCRGCPFLPATRPRPSLEARCARTAGWKEKREQLRLSLCHKPGGRKLAADRWASP